MLTVLPAGAVTTKRAVTKGSITSTEVVITKLCSRTRRYDSAPLKTHAENPSVVHLLVISGPCHHSSPMEPEKPPKPQPGDGLRSLRSTMLFRAVNYELYVRPNAIIMGLGVATLAGCTAYIMYMRSKFESMGFYAAVQSDGSEMFTKKVSKWDE